VRAGKGELTASDVSALIDKKSKDAVREVMPACGLYLMQVKYK
jgi:tRNA U38,U39,U40 pseudouridine synthase TruA